MKVQIKDLHPNPFRDLDNYPIDREKVENLKRSISSTDFWDNILGRIKKGSKLNGYGADGEYVGIFSINKEPIEIVEGGIPVEWEIEEGGVEIAYGHHRKIALEGVYPPSHEINIPVKDLDDSTMIKIMANENMEDWKVSPTVIHETVKVTKKFLDDHPEIREKYKDMTLDDPAYSKEALIISLFLNGNWKKWRVRDSLERLKLIDDEVISEEAVKSLPTERSAKDFVDTVKKVGGLSEEKQKRVAEKIRDGKRGEASMRSAVIEEKYSDQKKEKKKGFLIDFQAHLKEAVYHAKRLNERIDSLVIVKDHIDPDVYVEELKGLWIQVKILSLNIQKLDKKEKIKLLK